MYQKWYLLFHRMVTFSLCYNTCKRRHKGNDDTTNQLFRNTNNHETIRY